MKKVIILFTSIIITSVIITSCSKTPSTNLVEVTAKDYYFHMQDSIPSGWTTFRLKNEGHATHFFFLHFFLKVLPSRIILVKLGLLL
jgi:hypothetical protein